MWDITLDYRSDDPPSLSVRKRQGLACRGAVPMSAAHTIVIVDDHEDSLRIYTTMLRHFGFETVTANDGYEAIDTIRRILPSAVVTDFHLPGLDGCELVKALSRDPATASIPAVLVTADARPEIRRRAEEAGCAEFLLKPSTPKHLAEVIEKLIGPAKPLEETA
jgi:CheY-like chemotaxis protein